VAIADAWTSWGRDHGMLRVVQLDSGNGYLRFTADESSTDYLVAELHTDGLSASRDVVPHYATGFRDLTDFFRKLASDWLGWAGIREWRSRE
jgi:hypothetical protein